MRSEKTRNLSREVRRNTRSAATALAHLRGGVDSVAMLTFHRRGTWSEGSRVAAVAIAVCLVVSVLGAPAAGAQPVAVSEPMLADIELRDRLIADQENLLNTYRCLFGVDVDVVPGGCDDPDTVVAGAAPQSPTQGDLEVRDGLIQSQESLLNVYRCQYNIDTQLVPGGCGASDDPEGMEPPQPSPVAIVDGTNGVVCTLQPDQTIACWNADSGNNVDGPSGQYASFFPHADPHPPPDVSCGLRVDQTLFCWTWKQGEQGEDGNWSYVLFPVEAPSGQFIDLFSSGDCGTRVDQVFLCWHWSDDFDLRLDFPDGGE